MSSRVRSWIFASSAVVVMALLVYAAAGLPEFGTFSGAYEDYLNKTTSSQRHVENIPTAVNFDVRGFDTLGEEFIFFTSVAGVLFMLSSLRGKTHTEPEPKEREDDGRRSGAIRWFLTGLTAFLAALGMDLGAHGQLTPGGGFQGGAVFGSAMACIYLGLGLDAFVKTLRKEVFDFLEGTAAFGFAAIGVATAFAAGAFLKNVLPLGQTGATVSAGSIYLINVVVFVEIAAGFTVLMLTFLKQTRAAEEPEQ